MAYCRFGMGNRQVETTSYKLPFSISFHPLHTRPQWAKIRKKVQFWKLYHLPERLKSTFFSNGVALFKKCCF